jgi:DNA invertase Pin-like site-specific DNA recombinase
MSVNTAPKVIPEQEVIAPANENIPTAETATGYLVGYARVSTDEQNFDLQLTAFERAGVHMVFQEKVSGTKKNRPELEHCLASLRPGDTLVVWKLDRLGRNTKHLIEILEELKSRSVHFRSLQDYIDTNSPIGNFFFTVLAAFAQLERDFISERTKAGLAAARANSLAVG